VIAVLELAVLAVVAVPELAVLAVVAVVELAVLAVLAVLELAVPGEGVGSPAVPHSAHHPTLPSMNR
jgi:hypothetical protein